MTMESMIANGSALVGTPAEVIAALTKLSGDIGGIEHASMQVNFHLLPYADALASMQLFGRAVIPHFANAAAVA